MRKKTLRRLPPFTRKLARLQADTLSCSRRLKNLLEEARHLELLAQAAERSMPKAV